MVAQFGGDHGLQQQDFTWSQLPKCSCPCRYGYVSILCVYTCVTRVTQRKQQKPGITTNDTKHCTRKSNNSHELQLPNSP